jgi:NUMOD3 motif
MDRKRNMFYVGSHLGSVDDGYIGSNKRLLATYRKRPEDFKRRILFWLPMKDKTLLYVEEQRWLNFIRPTELHRRYYNAKQIASGGYGTCTETMKLKISESRKGTPAWNKGVPVSEEQKKKLSTAKTGIKLKIPRSEEYRKNISLRQIGKKRKPHTEQTKELMRNKQKGIKRKELQCPHCHMIGEISNMKHWHFDNCKTLARQDAYGNAPSIEHFFF